VKPHIEDIIANLPITPGVYLMKNIKGEVFYIGKAKNLRARLRSYSSGSDTRAFVHLLDRLLDDIEVILTHTDKEALIAENDLIKKYQPRFNIKLTDDKNFLCLRIDPRHAFPRLEIRRRFGKDKARYFGPYHSATAIRKTLRIVNRHFQLRTCSDQVLKSRTRPCLQYQIKRCPAPCVYELPAGEYQENVKSVIAFLDGRADELLQVLTNRMTTHAEHLRFEEAAQLRDQLRAIEKSLERQMVVSPDFVNRDVVGLYREGPAVEIHLMRTREGRLIEAKRYSYSKLELPTAEILSHFATQYYADLEDWPDEILFPPEMDWAKALEELLSDTVQRTLRVATPKRGHKARLISLATTNARQAFVDKQRQAGAAQTVLKGLKRSLRLSKVPEHLECFDISNLQSSHIVASAVAFVNGGPHKSLYRHYKIRSTATQDDFKSMYEVISRRARRGLEEGSLPDLMVIDGGKGQLNAARAALDDHGVDWVDLISLAKSRLTERGKTDVKRSLERVFVQGIKDPIVLRANSAELFLLMRARDEAHRFAIEFQRQQRRKAATRSLLDTIPGVGPQKRKALLSHFGSTKRVQKASLEELQGVVGPKLAQVIIDFFTPHAPPP
jgi:excinuclease ABC subunit C